MIPFQYALRRVMMSTTNNDITLTTYLDSSVRSSYLNNISECLYILLDGVKYPIDTYEPLTINLTPENSMVLYAYTHTSDLMSINISGKGEDRTITGSPDCSGYVVPLNICKNINIYIYSQLVWGDYGSVKTNHCMMVELK